MSASTSSHASVFADLRAEVRADLDAPDVVVLLAELAERGWRPRQLRDRVGALPVQPSPAQDAVIVLEALRRLLGQQSPQEAYDEELQRRAHRAQVQRGSAHEPASEQAKARWVSAIRSGLTGRARVPVGPPARLRPDCALCEGEAAYFVRRDVHLCARCVDSLAAGEVRAERSTGS